MPTWRFKASILVSGCFGQAQIWGRRATSSSAEACPEPVSNLRVNSAEEALSSYSGGTPAMAKQMTIDGA